MRRILLALGANQKGRWGCPLSTLRQAVSALGQHRLVPTAISPIFQTDPIGGPFQAKFLNAVVSVASDLPPGAVLRTIKQLERQAGRRSGQRWGPRPLDIDIIDDPGQKIGWSAHKSGKASTAPSASRSSYGRLVLPHPRLHQRAFVLVPLLAVAPFWRHPVLDQPGRTLLAAVGGQRRGIRLLHEQWLAGIPAAPNGER